MTWLTWRLERTTLFAAAALVVLFWVVVLVLDVNGPVGMNSARQLLTLGPPAFATVIAVFWGAPMVAREYEHRTYVLVWSRERSVTRWLAVRLVLLLAPLVVLTVAVNAIGHLLQTRMLSTLGDVAPPPDYDLWPPLQLATVIAGFGLGVLVGVLVRNAVLAMGITLVGYVVLRFALAVFARPHLLTPVRTISAAAPPEGAIPAGAGYLDQAGHELSMSDVQQKCLGDSGADYQQCLARNGVAHEYLDIQPVDRIPDVRLVELGIYAALAVVVFTAAWLVLRRRTVS